MARTLRDLVVFSATIVGYQPWLRDPRCLPIPWRLVEKKSRLKIAVMWNDGVVLPTPPVNRALKETVKKLRVAGHEIIDWNSNLHGQAVNILVS